MSLDDGTEAWGQLVSLTDIDSSAVPLVKNKFVIGRNSDNDLPFAGNKLVSGKHCLIQRDADGKVWLHDTSTNGTLLNQSIKVIKGERRELKHGDEVHIIYKKGNPESDIGYIFQDIEALRAEESSSEQGEDTKDYTLPTADVDCTLTDCDVNEVSASEFKVKKRKSKDSPQPAPSKKLRTGKKGGKVSALPGKETSESLCQPSKDERAAAASSEKAVCGTEKEHEICPSTSASSTKPVKSNSDAMADTLMCIICQGLFHDCISLQPCMHSFCGGCYSEWMERSKECPSCRLEVQRINKNHIVNNLVEAYLQNNPEKGRPKDELEELDAKNKITRDMLYPERQPKDCDVGSDVGSDMDSDEYVDSSDEDLNDDDDGHPWFIVPFGGRPPVPFNPPWRAFHTDPLVPPAPKAVCRQCPNYKETFQMTSLDGPRTAQQFLAHMATFPEHAAIIPTIAAPTAEILRAGPSTADTTVTVDPDAKVMPQPPVFRCAPNQNHVLCLCCLLPMPKRQGEDNPGLDRPPQQCAFCYKSYCHAYWGCRKEQCDGCLAKLKDMNFTKKCLNTLILNNPFESSIFKDYLQKKGYSVRDVLADCLAKMVTGEFSCADLHRLKDGINTPVCYACGIKVFQDLAYYYRKNVPKEELPAYATKRTDCYWGKNCRTQRNKPEHARKFNHICEQTRTV